MPETNLTQRQQRYFASLREGLERDTGKSMDEWVTIARQCPEEGHRARLKWFKDNHGLLQNRASQVLEQAFGSKMTWSDPQALMDSLWAEPGAHAIFEAVEARAAALPGTIRTVRKGYTAWSRTVQFAALRPMKSGGAVLGLAVAPGIDGRLEGRKSEPWSERLSARLVLANSADVDEGLAEMLRLAWEGA
jgi:Domain of unknown function (DUF4287)/Domain of unknown function (DUF5655)